MIKTKLMHKYKEKFGGTFVKEDGRWFWVKGKEKHLVTSGWILSEMNKPVSKPKTIKIEPKVEVTSVSEKQPEPAKPQSKLVNKVIKSAETVLPKVEEKKEESNNEEVSNG